MRVEAITLSATSGKLRTMEVTGNSRVLLTLWLFRHRPLARGSALVSTLVLIGTLAALARPHPISLAARLNTGPSPVAVAVDPGTDTLYAASRLDEAVRVLDRQSGRPLGDIHLGAQPAALALDATHHGLYVASNDATLTVVDTRTQAVLCALPVGSRYVPDAELSFQVAADPSTGRAYVPDTDQDAVAVVDADQTPLPPLPVGHHPVAVAVDPRRGRLYVANAGDGTLSVLTIGTGALLAAVSVGGIPVALAVDPEAGRVYVADYGRARVAVLDATTPRVIGRVPVAPFPTAIAVDPATHNAFVTHSNDDALTVLDGTASAVIGVLSVGQRPDAIAADPALARVYFANEGGDDLAVLRDRPGELPIVLVKGAPPQPPEDCADRCVEAIHAHE